MSGNTLDEPRYAPRFEVTLDGERLSEPGERITDLVVETTLDGADRFQFALSDALDDRRDAFRDLSWDRFAVGTDVRIDAGYGSDRSLTTLFVGRVGTVTGSFGRDTGPAVEVAGFGLSRDLMTGTRSDAWTETTVGRVAEDVLSGYDFSTVEVRGADERRSRLLQHEQNDYRFLTALAETYGFEFHARRETVRFAPAADSEGGADATLAYGDTLASYEGRASPSPTAAEVRAWDPDSVSTTAATTSAADAGPPSTFVVPPMSRRAAGGIADAAAERLADTAVSGHGRADGDPSVQAGATVDIEGVGERFGGRYRVTAATHRLGGDGYRTTFECEEVEA